MDRLPSFGGRVGGASAEPVGNGAASGGSSGEKKWGSGRWLSIVAAVLIVIFGVGAVVFMAPKAGDDSRRESFFIFDSFASIDMDKTILAAMTEGVYAEKAEPGYVQSADNVITLSAEKAKAATIITLVPKSEYKETNSISQFILEYELMKNIDLVEEETFRETKKQITMSGIITNNQAKDIKQYKYDVVIAKGTNYNVIAVTQIRDTNLNDFGAVKWAEDMRSLKILDDKKTNILARHAIGAPLVDVVALRLKDCTMRYDEKYQIRAGVPLSYEVWNSDQSQEFAFSRNEYSLFGIGWLSGENFDDFQIRSVIILSNMYDSETVRDPVISELKEIKLDSGMTLSYYTYSYFEKVKDLSDPDNPDAGHEESIMEVLGIINIEDGLSYNVTFKITNPERLLTPIESILRDLTKFERETYVALPVENAAPEELIVPTE